MTREEKQKRIRDNCINCEFCPLYDAIPIGEYCFGYDADIDRNYNIMFGKGELHDRFETDHKACKEHFGE